MLDLSARGICRVYLSIALLLASAPLAAADAPADPPKIARMIDARVNFKDAYLHATKLRDAAVEAGRTKAQMQAATIVSAINERMLATPGFEARISPYTGGPEMVSNLRGALTAASPASDEIIVRSFLQNNAGIYGLSPADLDDLVTLGDSPGGSSGLRMLRMEQQIDGRPVFQSETRFLIDRSGRLVSTLGRFVPQARAFAPAGPSDSALTAQAALVRLAGADGVAVDPASFTVSSDLSGRLTLTGTDTYINGPVSARPVLFPLAPGLLVQAWSVVAFTNGAADWYAVVDAETGDLLWRKNIRAEASAHDARFRVYVQPDGKTPADSPAPQSPSPAVVGAGTQYPEIAPSIVSMQFAMSATASPNGWINDCPGGICTANETQTLGNNSIACLDRTGGAGAADVCDTDVNSVLDGNGRPTGNPDANARNRDFLGTTPRDFQTNYLPPPQAGNPEAGQTATGTGTALDIFRRGLVTNLFYVTNWYHDQLFALGFDEASGNFQQTNFSGFGVGNDRVNADAQDSSGTSNANFSTPPDGTGGRMQMYRFTGPTIDRDGSLDSEIMMHELTHGTSNRLVGNATGLNWDPAAGMGEGWSDFFAMSLLNNTNADNPMGNYATGGYATYKLAAGYLDNYVYGIRRFPITADKTVNPLTWADVDDVTNNLSGGITPDPLGFNINGGFEVHNIGEVWANTLWDVRRRVIADPAGANGSVPTGNHTMLQLVTDGLKMTPLDPTFTEARDAILNADCATNACANEVSIWAGFANRGLGYRAAAPYKVLGGYVSSHEGVQESLLSPYLDVVNPATDVTINDTADNNNGGIDPGEAIKISVKLTNPWRGASKSVPSATATLSTTTPGIAIYTATSTYGAIAPLGSATGTQFLFTVAPSVLAGSPIDFSLSVTSALGTTTTTFRLRVGERNGNDAPVTYTDTIAPALTITSNRPRGVFHQMNITDDYQIADLNFRVDNITHPGVGDLTAMLRSPQGLGADVLALIDGLNDLGGTSIVNMVIDDDVPNIATNDMVEATSASAPYTKSWQPVYNAPWAALVDPTLPGDPVGMLTRFDGGSTKGVWSALVSDAFSVATGGTNGNGTWSGWSLIITPAHFDVVPFAAAVSLTATKTVSGTFRTGNTVTYTVVLTNNGTANQADNAGNEFSDILPASLTLTGATATGGTAGTAGNTVTWNGSLAPLGGSVTITITATINAGTQNTTISNQGTASYDADGNGTNESTKATDDPAVGGTADPTTFAVGGALLTGTKTASGSFTTGSTVTYTIILNNSGNTASTNLANNELTDVLPSGLTLVSATASSGTATATVGTNTVTWNGSVPAAGSVTITVTATVNAGQVGSTISNQATIVYDADLNGMTETTTLSDDPSVAGSANPTAFVVAGAILSGTKTASGAFTVGSTVTYTIVLSNSGPSASLNNAGNELTDVLPSGLTLVSASATSGTAVATVGTNTVTWNGSVPAAGTVTVTVTATINAGTNGTTISNQGSISYDADLNGTNETTTTTDDPSVGGTNDATTFLVGSTTLSATKTVSGSFVQNGTVTYTIVISNPGASASLNNPGNELTDVLPSGLTLISATASSGTAVATVGTNTVTWNGSVPAAGSVTVTVTASVNPGTTGSTISNQATLAYDADLNGTNETTTTSDDPAVGGAHDPTTFVVSGATVTATKVASGPFTTGSTVTYTIVLHNSGTSASPNNATDELTDVLPSSLTLVSASAGSGTALATVGTNTVTWNGSVPVGTDVTVTITATIHGDQAGNAISNQASVHYDADLNGTNETTVTSDDPGVAGSNNPTVFTAVAAPTAILSATKTASGTFVAGSPVTYTIVIHNTGTAASLNNAGNELTDVLPPALQLASATATSGTAVATVGTNTVTWNGSVPAGGTVTLTINAVVNPGFAGTTANNQATLSYDADLNGTNESTAVSDDPSTAAANDPTSSPVVGSTVAIPTLSPLMLLLVALGFSMVALFVKRA